MARQIYTRRTRTQQGRDQGRRVGQAVGTIGTQLGDAYDEFKDAKDKTIAEHKAVDDQLETILNEGNEEIYPELEFEDNPDLLEMPEVIDEFDDPIIPQPHSGGSGGNKTGEAIKGFMPSIEGVLGTNQNTSFTPIMGNNGNPYPQVEPPKPFYGPDYNALQKVTPGANPENKGGFDLGPLWEAIKSPFKRTETDPYTGTTIGEGYKMRAVAPSYLGDIGAAGAEGYNRVIDRHNYKRMVWEHKQNELDQQFGELVVPPSGVAPFDASVENMAREWKTELAQLQRDKGNIDPEEYTARKHEIMGYSQTYKKASEQINQLLTDYANDKDKISASTKPETLDLIETLSQGGDVQIANVNGSPTLVGQTLGGKPISVPLAQIANGKNAFRYNTKVDISQGMNNIVKQLGALKQNIETQSGQKISGPQAWEQVQGSAAAQLDTLLANEATARAIAADTFNLDYDAWEQMGSQRAKEWTKDMLMQRLEQQYAPVQQARTVTQPRGNTPKQSVVDQRNQANAQAVAQTINSLPDYSVDSLQSLVGGKISEVYEHADGTILVSGNKEYVLPKDPQKARWMLSRIMGVQEQYLR